MLGTPNDLRKADPSKRSGAWGYRTLRRPRTKLTALAAVMTAVLAFGITGVNRLYVSADDFNASGAQSTAAGEAIERLTGMSSAPTIAVLLHTRHSASSPEGLAESERVASLLEHQRGIASVISYPRLSAIARSAPLSTELFFSRDDRWTAIAATLAKGISGTQRTAAVIHDLQLRLSPNHRILLGGSATAGVELGDQLRHDIEAIELWSLPLLLVLLVVIFRRPSAAMLPLAIGALTTGQALAIVHILTLLDVHVSLFVLSTITGLSVGLGIDYSLLILSRLREEINNGSAVKSAMDVVLGTACRTVLFSGLTIASAVSALMVFDVPFLFSVGLGGALSALLASGNAVVFVPAVVSARADLLVLDVRRSKNPHSPGWQRISKTVTRHPGAIAGVALIVMLALAIPTTTAALQAENTYDLAPIGSSRQAAEILTEKFRPAASAEILTVLIHSSRFPQALDLQRSLSRTPDVLQVTLRSLNRKTWILGLLSKGGRLSTTSQKLVERIRTTTRAGVEVTGPSARFIDQQNAIVSLLPPAIFIVIFSTFVFMTLMTGSIIVPAKTIVMNTLSFFAAFGVLILIFQDGLFAEALGTPRHGSVEALQLIIIFSCTFALATDYNIFVISRIQEEHRNTDRRKAIADGLCRSGPVVTSAAFLFCVTVGVFTISGVVLLKEISVGLFLAVTIDATIVRILLLPAVMTLLGKYNWWAPELLRRRARA